MTDLNKPVTRRGMREYTRFSGRRLIISLKPGDIVSMKEERKQQWFDIQMEDLYMLIVKRHVDGNRL
ncbi:hypothetical protein ACFLQL_00660 [Verrucomicrobiota bacterium]